MGGARGGMMRIGDMSAMRTVKTRRGGGGGGRRKRREGGRMREETRRATDVIAMLGARIQSEVKEVVDMTTLTWMTTPDETGGGTEAGMEMIVGATDVMEIAVIVSEMVGVGESETGIVIEMAVMMTIGIEIDMSTAHRDGESRLLVNISTISALGLGTKAPRVPPHYHYTPSTPPP